MTQFEALTAAAYHELARRGVEVAVVEAGLGGRFDATNVIPSKVQVLTSVSLEHTRWLGPTLTDIAREKLAVVRDHSTLVVGPLPHGVFAIAQQVAAEHHAKLVAAPPHAPPLRAAGRFQEINFGLAAAAAEAFLGRPLDERALKEAAAADGRARSSRRGGRAAVDAVRRRPQPLRRPGAGRLAARGVRVGVARVLR